MLRNENTSMAPTANNVQFRVKTKTAWRIEISTTPSYLSLPSL